MPMRHVVSAAAATETTSPCSLRANRGHVVRMHNKGQQLITCAALSRPKLTQARGCGAVMRTHLCD
jgi:hypothetical protein